MYTPSLKTAASTMFRLYSLYHLASLRASDIAQMNPELLARYESAHETLGVLLRAREDAEYRLVEAGARRDRAHHLMERGLRDFAYASLGVVQEDRAAPRYRLFFPSGYGFVGRANTETLIAEASRILATLSQVSDERFGAAGEALSHVLEQVQAVQSEYEAARDALEAAARAVENGKRPWREAYRSSYHHLSILHMDDPRRADDYFRRLDRRRSAERDAAEETEDGVDIDGEAVDAGSVDVGAVDVAAVDDESVDVGAVDVEAVEAEAVVDEAEARIGDAVETAAPAEFSIAGVGVPPTFESEGFIRVGNG